MLTKDLKKNFICVFDYLEKYAKKEKEKENIGGSQSQI